MQTRTDLYVNARFRGRPISGVERYARETLRRTRGPITPVAPRFASGGLAGHLWEQFVLPARASGGALWSPANTGPLAVARQLLTIHDLAPLDQPGWYRSPFSAWYRWLWPRLAVRVRTVVAVSVFTRSRITARLGLPAETVPVVPVGVDPEQFSPRPPAEVEALRARHGIPERYLLFVGALQPRKNLGGLVEAFKTLRPEFPGLGLVVAGMRGRQFAGMETLPGTLKVPPTEDPKSLPPTIRFLGRVPDADLPALYTGATVFVQPSFYEGAALTVLEALSCGCPAAAARGSALEEYLGEAGPTFDPAKPDEISAAIRPLLGDATRRDHLKAAGIERAREYSWARCAGAIEEILESIRPRASP